MVNLFKIEKINTPYRTNYLVYILGLKLKFSKRKNVPTPNFDIPHLSQLLKQNTQFPHPVGIVISSAATIGNNCIIYQNVTIGAKTHNLGNKNSQNYPTIGNNVIIYAGAVICGSINIGDNVVIGANSVVLNDVPSNATVAGNPAKIIKIRK